MDKAELATTVEMHVFAVAKYHDRIYHHLKFCMRRTASRSIHFTRSPFPKETETVIWWQYASDAPKLIC